jgi:hypothetical protein
MLQNGVNTSTNPASGAAAINSTTNNGVSASTSEIQANSDKIGDAAAAKAKAAKAAKAAGAESVLGVLKYFCRCHRWLVEAGGMGTGSPAPGLLLIKSGARAALE